MLLKVDMTHSNLLFYKIKRKKKKKEKEKSIKKESIKGKIH